jgi:hypothetical protein
MTNGARIIRFAVFLVIVAIITYLSWIGSQFVLYRNVNLDLTDNFMVWIVAWYATRDLVKFDDVWKASAKKR